MGYALTVPHPYDFYFQGTCNRSDLTSCEGAGRIATGSFVCNTVRRGKSRETQQPALRKRRRRGGERERGPTKARRELAYAAC